MSSKLLPLILLAAIPTASENLASGYHIGQQWMNTATGAMYKCIGDGSWQQSCGYGDSPTFAGLTSTGTIVSAANVAPGAGVALSALTIGRETSTGAWIQSYGASAANTLQLQPLGGALAVGGAATFGGDVSVVRASNPAVLKVDGIASGTAGGSATYFLAGGSLIGAHGIKSAISGSTYVANIWTYFVSEYHIGASSANPATRWESNGRVTFYSTTAPGTAGANEVRIGGGQINAAGPISAGSGGSPNSGLVITGLYAGIHLDGDLSASDVNVKYTKNGQVWSVGASVGESTSNFVWYDITGGAKRLVLTSGGDLHAAGVVNAYEQFRVTLLKTPASASDTGTVGSLCFDTNYIYVCTATNTWKRVAIATW